MHHVDDAIFEACRCLIDAAAWHRSGDVGMAADAVRRAQTVLLAIDAYRDVIVGHREFWGQDVAEGETGIPYASDVTELIRMLRLAALCLGGEHWMSLPLAAIAYIAEQALMQR